MSDAFSCPLEREFISILFSTWNCKFGRKYATTTYIPSLTPSVLSCSSGAKEGGKAAAAPKAQPKQSSAPQQQQKPAAKPQQPAAKKPAPAAKKPASGEAPAKKAKKWASKEMFNWVRREMRERDISNSNKLVVSTLLKSGWPVTCACFYFINIVLLNFL